MDIPPKKKSAEEVLQQLLEISTKKLREGIAPEVVEQDLNRQGVQAGVAKALVKKAMNSGIDMPPPEKIKAEVPVVRKLLDFAVTKLREGVTLGVTEQYLVRQGAHVDVAKILVKRALSNIDICDHKLSFDVCLAIADEARVRGDSQKELQCCLEIYRSQQDKERHPALRMQNMYHLVSSMLLNPFENDNYKRAKEIIISVQEEPCSYTGTEDELSSVQRFERFYRATFDAVDIDTVFGPSFEVKPWDPMAFFHSDGVPVSVQSLQAYIRDNQIEVIFCSGTSEEYGLRYIEDYTSSIVASCDCKFIVLVCLIGGGDIVNNILEGVPVRNPNLFYCVDNFFDPEGQRSIMQKTKPAPQAVYHASAILIKLSFWIQNFGLPIFMTGIDTIVQRGVKDLLDRTRGMDVVLNMIKEKATMSSQTINNLVMARPTPRAMIFAEFLRNYLGEYATRDLVCSYSDQLILNLARCHLLFNDKSSQIGEFDEYDINNIMFNKKNYHSAFGMIKKYRFLNIFRAGNLARSGADLDLDPREILSRTSAPHEQTAESS